MWRNCAEKEENVRYSSLTVVSGTEWTIPIFEGLSKKQIPTADKSLTINTMVSAR